jgi:Ni/Co efflux regulator RcnB
VSLNARPTVTAGFAKLVEEVNQYAAPMKQATAAAGQMGRERDERVEVGAGDRSEHGDQDTQAEDGGQRVGQQLHTDVVGQQLGLDAGPDHHGDQDGRADRFGGHAAAQ